MTVVQKRRFVRPWDDVGLGESRRGVWFLKHLFSETKVCCLLDTENAFYLFTSWMLLVSYKTEHYAGHSLKVLDVASCIKGRAFIFGVLDSLCCVTMGTTF